MEEDAESFEAASHTLMAGMVDAGFAVVGSTL